MEENQGLSWRSVWFSEIWRMKDDKHSRFAIWYEKRKFSFYIANKESVLIKFQNEALMPDKIKSPC